MTDRDKTTIVVLSLFLAAAIVALTIVTVMYCLKRYNRAGRLLSTMDTTRAEDSLKIGSTLTEDTASQDIAVKQATPHKVILSMTTSPERIDKIHRLLQTIHPAMYDKIELNLPVRYKRTGKTYDIPSALATFPKLEIVRIEEDLGPVTKVLPTLMRHRDAIVISMDDDIAYSTHNIASMLDALRHYDYNCVVARSWFKKSLSNMNLPAKPDIVVRPTDKNVDIVEGYGLVAYCAWLVDAQLIESFSKLCKQCFTSDDLTISFALALHKVPRIAIDVDKASPDVTALSYGFASDALHKN